LKGSADGYDNFEDDLKEKAITNVLHEIRRSLRALSKIAISAAGVVFWEELVGDQLHIGGHGQRSVSDVSAGIGANHDAVLMIVMWSCFRL
jgi:hypothetical protein